MDQSQCASAPERQYQHAQPTTRSAARSTARSTAHSAQSVQSNGSFTVSSAASGSGARTIAAAASSSAPVPGQLADELHMPGMSPQRPHLSSLDYAPQIKLEQPPSAAAAAQQPQPRPQYHPPPGAASSVPGVLQPGGLSARPTIPSANTAPAVPTIHGALPSRGRPSPSSSSHIQRQHQRSQEFQAPDRPSPSLAMSHAYSRSSPSGAYDSSTAGGYHPYTPTTPGGGTSSSQFMSPTDMPRYSQPGSQRHFSNTPLGLADIRPRADSSISDGGGAGTVVHDLANTQSGTSNYMTPWPIYAFDWCKWRPQANGAGKIAVGSYLEDGHNFIQILDSHATTTPSDVYSPGSSKYTLEFNKVAEATHSYPVTRLLWEPPSSQKQSTDLLATSGDHLRLWSLPSDAPATPGNSVTRRSNDTSPSVKLTPLALLSNSKTPDHTAPLTSLDWNTMNPALIITSSIDTTCTIWDIPSLTAKTQLIAHDKEVYDVRFCANTVDVFVSCGQDGSVRMFDLRSLEHSTIIYEPSGKDDKDETTRVTPPGSQQSAGNPPPLLRLATSPHDTHLLATFAQDSGAIRILDARQPGQALLELRGHNGPVNCLDWSPLRRGLLATGGDDCQVLLWDLMNASSSAQTSVNGTPQQDSNRSPVASWECDYEIGNLAWAPHLQSGEYGEWLGVSGGRGVWGTRVS